MIQNIFPSYFYSLMPLSNKEEVLKTLEKAKVDHEGSSHIEWNKYCSVKVEQLYVKDFASLLSPSVTIFLDNAGINDGIKLDSIWRNTYGLGGYQEIHDHIVKSNSELSGCIFLEDQTEDASKFFFFNRQSSEISKKWKHVLGSNKIDVFNYFLNPKAGDILFFPSYMLHGVTAHKSKKPRTTLSFNFNFI